MLVPTGGLLLPPPPGGLPNLPPPPVGMHGGLPPSVSLDPAGANAGLFMATGLLPMVAGGLPGMPSAMQPPPPPRPHETFRPGDWNCPGCGSHNFATRMECRRCKMPKPSVGSTGSGDQASKMLEGPGSSVTAKNDDAKKTSRWPIFVGNISFDTREEEVADIFRGCEGLITFQLAMNTDGSGSRGYGFAEFETCELAQEAMRKKDGTEVRGRSLRLRWGQSAPSVPEKDSKEEAPPPTFLEPGGPDKVLIAFKQFDGTSDEEKQRKAYAAVLGPRASHMRFMMKQTGCLVLPG